MATLPKVIAFVFLLHQHGRFRKPVVSLRTRKSLRAVHFHPQGIPFMLTAEVQENQRDPIRNVDQAVYYDFPQVCNSCAVIHFDCTQEFF